jgi:signal transduction protein with GAF and PtsI domain
MSPALALSKSGAGTVRIDIVDVQAGTPPYARSLKAILKRLKAATLADGCYLYEYSDVLHQLTLREWQGPLRQVRAGVRQQVPAEALEAIAASCHAFGPETGASEHPLFKNLPEVASEAYEALSVIPLRTANKLLGFVTAAYRSRRGRSPHSAEGVAQLAGAAAAILVDLRRRAGLRERVQRLSDLEAELLDIKIAERADGIVTDNGVLTVEGSETIASHVASVLDHQGIQHEVESLTVQLEGQIETRRLLREAKQLLQTTRKMTEEEAYIYLRAESRRSRTPLSLIARALIHQEAAARLPKGLTA